jgi:hypothetical protein
MTKILDMHKKWLENPEYIREYEALEGEFAVAASVERGKTAQSMQKRKREPTEKR